MTTGELRRNKYLVLLVTLIVLAIQQSLPHGVIGGPLLAHAFLLLTFVVVFFVVLEQPGFRLLSLGAALVSLAGYAALYVLPQRYEVTAAVAYHAFLFLYLALAVTVILTRLFRQKSIRTDEVLGTLCSYLLLGAAWANLFAVAELIVPGSFNVSSPLDLYFADLRDRHAVFNYFSLVTLTTMGYGDVTPARGPATALAVLEAVFGQFYIAVVVAQLVGIRLAQAFERGDGP